MFSFLYFDLGMFETVTRLLKLMHLSHQQLGSETPLSVIPQMDLHSIIIAGKKESHARTI